MTQTVAQPAAEIAADPALFLEVQHFYGRQMRHLDEGRVDAWAETFTEDGVFQANAHPKPQSGRAAIRAGATAAHQTLAEQGITRRHWLGMLEVATAADGTIVAQTYAMVLNTPQGGKAELTLSCACRDSLVRVDGTLQVRHRWVTRDDLPK